MADKYGGRYGGVAPPVLPRIGGSLASYTPYPQGADQALLRHQVAPGLGIAGRASVPSLPAAGGPWMGLAQALNSFLASSSGAVGAGSMFGAGFGRVPAAGGVPSRRTIYGPGPRAF